jgi:hypothetical protein
MRSVVDSPDFGSPDAGSADATSPDVASADADFDDESARKLVLLTVGAVIAFILAAGVAVALTRADSAGSSDPSAVSSDAVAGTGTGPVAGTDVATYAADRARALAGASGRWAAVVSLRSYVTEDQASRTFGPLSPSALLAAAPGGDPAVVRGPVTAWMAQARTDAVEERKQLLSMAASTDDPSFRDQFNADADRLSRLLDQLDPAKPVVFGFVVTASAAELRSLASQPDVRLVDVVGRSLPDRLDDLHGLRPEETVKAGDPRTRPLP